MAHFDAVGRGHPPHQILTLGFTVNIGEGMWLVSDLTPADIDNPQRGTVIAGRIEADNLGAPFKPC